MKKIFSILILATTFVACKKNDEDIPATGSTINRIKTMTVGNTTVNYTYNDQGKITKHGFSGGTWTDYEYSQGLVKERTHDNSGTVLTTFIMEVNNDGMNTHTTIANDPVYDQVSIYNADKNLLKRTTKLNTGNTQVEDFYYSNGNLDSLRISNNGAWSSTSVLSYYTDKANALNYETRGYGLLFGKDSKNILKSLIYKSPTITGQTENYTYVYDAAGKITQQTVSEAAAISVSLYDYY